MTNEEMQKLEAEREAEHVAYWGAIFNRHVNALAGLARASPPPCKESEIKDCAKVAVARNPACFWDVQEHYTNAIQARNELLMEVEEEHLHKHAHNPY